MSLTVTLDGADISTALIDSATVHREERAAGIAKFAYHVAGAPPLPDAIIGKAVTMAWSGTRIYTGDVNAAEWDPYRRTYAVTCSDLLQEEFEGKTDAQIIALIPGARYSNNIHGAREDGWQYALDCLSTVPTDLHKDRNGALQTPAYAAKGTPDHTLGGGQVLNDGEYKLDLAKRRDLVTRQVIRYEYRVSRWKRRTHSFAWDALDASVLANGGWCEWLHGVYQFQLPTRDAVTSAANGTGWAVVGAIDFETYPDAYDAAGDPCGTSSTWDPGDLQGVHALGATWDGERHWAQTITETYDITLDVVPAQTDFGVSTHEDSAAYAVEADDAAMESGADPDVTGWGTDALGDSYQDQADETARDNDIQALIGMGVTRIAQSLRASSVSVATELLPALELADTVEIDTADINAQGKVRRIAHSISARGATTTVRIAISRGGAGAGDTLSTPARPATAPSHAAPNGSTLIITRVGGHHTTTPNYDPAWEDETGYVTNVFPYICSAPNCPTPEQFYQNPGFRALGPDIEPESRDEVTATATVTYNLNIPQDTLVLL